jgi:hypothetical protein
MAEWLFDKSGNAKLILDNDCIRNRSGVVVGWLSSGGAFSINGNHIGWFDRGVIYDRNNNTLGFTHQADGYVPSRPGLAGAPGMPGFAGRPGRPGFSGMFGRPGFGGWSQVSLDIYFNET